MERKNFDGILPKKAMSPDYRYTERLSKKSKNDEYTKNQLGADFIENTSQKDSFSKPLIACGTPRISQQKKE